VKSQGPHLLALYACWPYENKPRVRGCESVLRLLTCLSLVALVSGAEFELARSRIRQFLPLCFPFHFLDIVHLSSLIVLFSCGGLLQNRLLGLMIVRLSSFSSHVIPYLPSEVPLGNRRRFGPAPVEESAPPQLAQPSPSAYPRPRDDSSRTKEEYPSTGTPSPGKSAATYSLHCTVHIGNNGTLHRSRCHSECFVDIVMFETASWASYTNPNHELTLTFYDCFV
jgi:hypothetical protein